MSSTGSRSSSQTELPFVLQHPHRRSELIGAIEKLRSDWEALPAKSPMQSYTWARSCSEAFTNKGFRIVTAGKISPRAIAVFVEDERQNELVPLGSELYEPTEFTYADASAAEELSGSIVGLGRPVFIRDMFTDCIMVKALRRTAGRRVVTQEVPGHPWLELDDSWLEPESHLNAGRRSDLRRARRNAEKAGSVQCEIISPSSETLAPLLRDAFLAESAGWKGGLNSALATDPKVGGFYSQFAKAACELGTLRIGMLRIGEKPAAMQLAIEQDGCFWLFKMGFDESFARFSPGTLLMVESLRSARERGCNCFEMMGASEAWNQIWAPRIRDAVAIRICPPSIRGWVNVVAEHTKGAIKRHLQGHGENSK